MASDLMSVVWADLGPLNKADDCEVSVSQVRVPWSAQRAFFCDYCHRDDDVLFGQVEGWSLGFVVGGDDHLRGVRRDVVHSRHESRSEDYGDQDD